MEGSEHFKLTKDQFRKWDVFCLENGSEMYENKDTYQVVHSLASDTYNIYVQKQEQSGMIDFLTKLLALKNQMCYTTFTQRYDLDIKGNFLESLSSDALYLHLLKVLLNSVY